MSEQENGSDVAATPAHLEDLRSVAESKRAIVRPSQRTRVSELVRWGYAVYLAEIAPGAASGDHAGIVAWAPTESGLALLT